MKTTMGACKICVGTIVDLELPMCIFFERNEENFKKKCNWFIERFTDAFTDTGSYEATITAKVYKSFVVNKVYKYPPRFENYSW